jgi:hypothetical protein
MLVLNADRCLQLYGLLDRSSDLFISFSGAYEAAGKQLNVLAGKACKEAAQHLMPSSSKTIDSPARARSTGAATVAAYERRRDVVLVLLPLAACICIQHGVEAAAAFVAIVALSALWAAVVAKFFVW